MPGLPAAAGQLRLLTSSVDLLLLRSAGWAPTADDGRQARVSSPSSGPAHSTASRWRSQAGRFPLISLCSLAVNYALCCLDVDSPTTSCPQFTALPHCPTTSSRASQHQYEIGVSADGWTRLRDDGWDTTSLANTLHMCWGGANVTCVNGVLPSLGFFLFFSLDELHLRVDMHRPGRVRC